jgi:alkylhydroperoxidase/carboxymuconolactone decarboxylase family protein YurZ
MNTLNGDEILERIEAAGRPRLPLYEFLAKHDLQGFAGFNGFLESAIYHNKALDEGTKEMLLACLCTAFNANPKAIANHCRKARKNGIRLDALLQALEMTAAVAAMQMISKGVTPLLDAVADESLAVPDGMAKR